MGRSVLEIHITMVTKLGWCSYRGCTCQPGQYGGIRLRFTITHLVRISQLISSQSLCFIEVAPNKPA